MDWNENRKLFVKFIFCIANFYNTDFMLTNYFLGYSGKFCDRCAIPFDCNLSDGKEQYTVL